MNIPYDEILAVVRTGGELSASFEALRQIGRAQTLSPFFDKLRAPDMETDVWLTGAWLDECIREYRPSIVSVGSDTLNEAGGNGFNLEIGMRGATEGAGSGRMDRHGPRHLVEGLHKVHTVYQRLNLGYPGSLLFHYLFFSDIAELCLRRPSSGSGSIGTACFDGESATTDCTTSPEYPAVVLRD